VEQVVKRLAENPEESWRDPVNEIARKLIERRP